MTLSKQLFEQLIIGRNDDGERMYLVSIGLGTIRFPAAEVGDICANPLLLDVLRNQSLQWLDGEIVTIQWVDQMAAQLPPVQPQPLTSQPLYHPNIEREMTAVSWYNPFV